jgi:hypothetical protein
MTTTAGVTILELTGHIIDSLTLAKVIDKIQAAGFDYQINDIQIGQYKTDPSTVHFSLWTQDNPEFEALLDELRAYGAESVSETNVSLAPCPADGVLPKGAYTRKNPPIQIQCMNEWLSVESQAGELAIVVDTASKSALLKNVQDIKAGDSVVVGHAGVRVMPMLKAGAHV